MTHAYSKLNLFCSRSARKFILRFMLSGGMLIAGLSSAWCQIQSIDIFNLNELVDHIGSDRELLLHFPDTNLTSNNETKKGLVISGVSNLSISSADSTLCTIIIDDILSDVIAFKNCNNVRLRGLSIGHAQAETNDCRAPVLRFQNCEQVEIENCGMFGSGGWGLLLSNTTNFAMTKSSIYDCKYSAVNAQISSAVSFSECVFRDNVCSDVFSFQSCSNISLTNCLIKCNSLSSNIFSRIGSTTGVFVESSSFINNGSANLQGGLPDQWIEFTGCSFYDTACNYGIKHPDDPESNLSRIQALKLELQSRQTSFNDEVVRLQNSRTGCGPKDQFETQNEYVNRLNKAAWTHAINANRMIPDLQKTYLSDVYRQLGILRSRTYETQNVSITWGQYSPDSWTYWFSLDHFDYKKEHFDCSITVPRTQARSLYQNINKLTIKGYLGYDIFDQISLVAIEITNPENNETYIHQLRSDIFLGRGVLFSSDGRFMKLHNKQFEYDMKIIDTNTLTFMPNDRFYEAIAFSNDGKYLAMSGENEFVIREVRSNRVVLRIDEYGSDHTYSPAGSFSPDGSLFLLCGNHGQFRVFDVATGQQLTSRKNDIDALKMDVSPNGQYLAIGYGYMSNGGVSLYDLPTGSFARKLPMGDKPCGGLVFSPDNRLLASFNDDVAYIYDLAGNKLVNVIEPGFSLTSVDFSNDGNFIAVAGSSSGTKAIVIDLDSWEIVKVVNSDLYGSVTFSPDDQFIILGGEVFPSDVYYKGSWN